MVHLWDMKSTTGFCDTIGNTPLIRLKKLSQATGCEILGKAEFLNPGGSVKDRAALGIVEDAERLGLLQPGGTIVEGTAGNTGIGLALVGNGLGYRIPHHNCNPRHPITGKNGLVKGHGSGSETRTCRTLQ